MKTMTLLTALGIMVCCLFPIHTECSKKWKVTVKDFQFVPYNLTHVKAGDTIQWVWEGGYHTTTSGSIPLDADPWHGVISEDSNSFFYVPRQNGSYEYYSLPDTAKGMNGRFTVYGATGIDASATTGDIQVFPNPCRDYFKVRCDNNLLLKEIQVYDLNGNLVGQFAGRNRLLSGVITIPAGDLPHGLLILKIVDSSGPGSAFRVIHE